MTYGGYSDGIVVDEHFVLRIPKNLDPAGVAPLLCAGITTYSPLRHWGVRKGKKVGIVGLGGLGHMGVKFAHASGRTPCVFTTSPGKTEDALASRRQRSRGLKKCRRDGRSTLARFDFILDSVSADHDLNAYLQLLDVDGNLTLVGAPEKPHACRGFRPHLRPAAAFRARAIGGIAETQEMLDFCGEHNITAEIEVIRIQQINEAYERLLKSDVKYRFVIDMASLSAS